MTVTLKALALAAIVAAASPASATVTEYTSQAAFDAAAPTATTFGFDAGVSIAAGGSVNVQPNPVSFQGLSFQDNVTIPDTVNGGEPILFLISAMDTPNYGRDFLSYQNTDVGIVGRISSAGTTAIGFSYGSYITNDPVVLTLNTGDSFTLTPATSAQFVGFTSTSPITSVTVNSPAGYSFDLITVSASGVVPEPAMWALILVGFGGVGVAMRTRRDRARAAA